MWEITGAISPKNLLQVFLLKKKSVDRYNALFGVFDAAVFRRTKELR